MLLAQKALTEGAMALMLYSAWLVDEKNTAPASAAQVAHQVLELLTPVTKSWPSKWCVAANDLAIQVHGGYGYTQDFSVEQFYRDNRLNPIHEGTYGIQAIDLLGRKIGGASDGALTALAAVIERCADRASRVPELARYPPMLRSGWHRLELTTSRLLAVADITERLANATCYLDAFGHVVVAWLWLEQALVVTSPPHQGDSAFNRGKLTACRYFFHWELPRIDRWLSLLDPLERTPLDAQDEWLG
jgi:butyryl-CoA dehydrogenase/acyl-CoA dehydrogenase